MIGERSAHHSGRRRILRFGLAGICAAAAMPARAAVEARPRNLAFENLHTGEALSVPYRDVAARLPDALGEIDHILRDFRTGEVIPIDRGLLDLVHRITRRLGTSAPVQIISGYRSPQTNAFLARHSSGVARHSLHMVGMAVDIRIPDRDLGDLRRVALALKGGGVGYYPRSNFVHVDTGRVRFW